VSDTSSCSLHLVSDFLVWRGGELLTEHIFYMSLAWPGGRNAVGELCAERLQTKISIPTEMDGPGVGTNPDEMLLGAAATCYLITLASLLEQSKVAVEQLSMTSDGTVDVINGVYTYKKIVHKPVIQLSVASSERDQKMTLRLAQKAETTCMISKALQGNVEITLEVTLL